MKLSGLFSLLLIITLLSFSSQPSNETTEKPPLSAKNYLLKLKAKLPGKKSSWIDSLSEMGDMLYDKGYSNFDSDLMKNAIDFLIEAVKLREELINGGNREPENMKEVVRTYNNIANYLQSDLGDFQHAQTYIDICIDRILKFRKLNYYQPFRMGRALHVRGQIRTETEGLAEAREDYLRAIDFYTQDRKWSVARKEGVKGKVYNDIIRLYNIWQMPDSAIFYYNKAIKSFESSYELYVEGFSSAKDDAERQKAIVDSLFKEDFVGVVPGLINAHFNGGISLDLNGDLEKSINRYNDARVLYENLLKVFDNDKSNYEVIRFQKINPNFDKLIVQKLTSRQTKNTSYASAPKDEFYAGLFNNLSIVHRKQKRWKEALSNSALAVQIIDDMLREGVDGYYLLIRKAMFLHNKGEIFFDKGDLSKALSLQERASHLLKSYDQNIVNNQKLLEVLKVQGIILTEMGRFKEAGHAFDEAIKLIDQVRLEANSMESRIEISRLTKDVFENAIIASLASNDMNRALIFAEKSKAYTLLETVRHNNAIYQIDSEDLKLEQDLKVQIQKIKSELGFYPSPELLGLLRGKEKELKKLQNKLLKNETYHKLVHGETVIPVKDIKQKLILSDQAMIEYFVGNKKTYIFLIEKSKNLQVKEVNLAGKDLEQMEQSLREGIYVRHNKENTKAIQNALEKQYAKTAKRMYDSLFAWVNLQTSAKRIIIIPDEALNLVPFGALLSDMPDSIGLHSNYRFLADDYTISYCYSAALLKEMKNNKSKNKRKKLIAFAPSFGTSSSSHGTKFRDGVLQPLQYATEEVSSICSSFPEENECELFIGIDKEKGATKENFLFEAQDIFQKDAHLSTHGFANDENPDKSFIAFNQGETINESQLLFLHELYNLKFNIETLMLCACETNRGRIKTGEGLMSFSRGLVVAGVRNIIATLWSIPDNEKTKDIAINYYSLLQQRKKGFSQASALNQAQKIIRNDANFADPYYWAGFIYIGNPELTKVNSSGIDTWIFIVVGGMFLTLFLFRRNMSTKP